MEAIEKFTLETARRRARLTQIEAAGKLGITANTLRNYETGVTQPDVIMIQKMTTLYAVAFDQLIFLES